MSKDNTLDERIEKVLALYTQQQLAEHPYATSQPYGKATEAIKSLIAEERRKARLDEINRYDQASYKSRDDFEEYIQRRQEELEQEDE